MVYIFILLSIFGCYGADHNRSLPGYNDRHTIIIQDDDAQITHVEPSVEEQLERKNTHFKLAVGGNVLSISAAVLFAVWHFMGCGQSK